ncbi:snaclec echicetin subunit alpha-like [Corythoichthys intestinalis]|uniref:snaclec echicetin subunit alpha-like n=1 Tax=Corythoichthys intestinalis TaxID=161448 RepID=UPI0025A5586F|nr:snaclec echicetin subunit alpha-like [Corythoichthys intestinalis]
MFYCFVYAGDRCPDDWIQLNNRCFLTGTEPLTFNDAESACNNQSGHLASIQNGAELALVDYISDVQSGSWIGLFLNEVLSLTWTDGSDTEFVGIFTSGSGCAVTSDTSTDDNPWTFVDCENEHPYVCTRDVFECALICTLDGDQL